MKRNLSSANVRRIAWYMFYTGVAIAIPCNLSCMDLLLLRMHFDSTLFGVIKSNMFLLPALVYFFAVDRIRRSGHNAAICRWSYCARILLPLLLPVTALLTDSPAVRLWTWVAVLAFGYTAAMIANNTLLVLFKESVVSRKFNQYSLLFNALLTVPGMLLNVPILFLLGQESGTEQEFLWRFLFLELLTGLVYLPAFLLLRNLARLHRPVPERKTRWRDKFRPLADRSYRVMLGLAMTRSVWGGLLIGYWIIYLVTVRQWSIGYIAAGEAAFSLLATFGAGAYGRLVDRRGYRFGFSALILLMVAVSGATLCCWEHFWAALLFFIVIDNGCNGIFSFFHTQLVNSAAFNLADPGYSENYLAISSLCRDVGSFIGAGLGSVLLKGICGNAAPGAGDFRIYFGITAFLLLPQLFFAGKLKTPNQ